MSRTLTFHFEGALADTHRLNFYEASRFQYAAARLLVKIAHFQRSGIIPKKITKTSNFRILLKAQTAGSFNIPIEPEKNEENKKNYTDLELDDILAYLSDILIRRVDDDDVTRNEVDTQLYNTLEILTGEDASEHSPSDLLDKLIELVQENDSNLKYIGKDIHDILKRRISEINRREIISKKIDLIKKFGEIDENRLVAMGAPLLREMSTAFRTSAETLEILSSDDKISTSIMYFDKYLAEQIETAAVDDEITPILGDITQFNKDNGWGKIRIENGAKTIGFTVPYDRLPDLKQELIDGMKNDLVYFKAYIVRDRSGEIIRLIAVGLLPTPKD